MDTNACTNLNSDLNALEGSRCNPKETGEVDFNCILENARITHVSGWLRQHLDRCEIYQGDLCKYIEDYLRAANSEVQALQQALEAIKDWDPIIRGPIEVLILIRLHTLLTSVIGAEAALEACRTL